MRNVRNLISFLLLFVTLPAFGTTVTGTIRDAYGQLWNGTITFAPNASVIDYISHEVVPSTPLTVNVVNGILYLTNGSTTISIKGNDTFLPSNTAYYALYKDIFGQPTNLYLYSITGSTYDLGTAIPTPITTTNISYGNLLGLNSVTIKPSSTSVTQLGIQTASAANVFSVINNKVVVGPNTSGNSLMQLFGTATAASTTSLTNPSGPFITLLDAGGLLNSGGGVIFGSNNSQFGAAIRYLLQNNAGNSQGDIAFQTRGAAGDATVRSIFTVRANNVVIGSLPGASGGGIEPNGGGFKHSRTIFASANPSVDVIVTWTTAFADTSYTAVCQVSNGFADTTTWETIGKTAGTLTVRVFGAAAHVGVGIDCMAGHD